MLQLLKKNGLAKKWRSLQQLQLSLPQNSQSGFTIIESLVAVVVLAVLLTALSPVIVLSVATRVQARRVELGTQAARAYIDGVRAGTIDAPSNTITLNEVNMTNNTFNSQRSLFAAAPVPATGAGSLSSCPTTTGNQYCQNSSTTTPSLYCIDLDSGGCSSGSPKDLVVQAFRSITSASTDSNQGYLLGVRVYRADAFNDNVPLNQPNNGTLPTQATFTGGLGNRKVPLVEMTTEIVTTGTNYGNLCSRLGGCQ